MTTSIRWLSRVPVSPARLGATPPADITTFDGKAWGVYLQAVRDSLDASRKRAVAAYTGLKQVRADLGLPFIVDTVTEGQQAAGAWNSTLDQQAVDVNAMAVLLIQAADEAIQGKRQVAWDPVKNDLAIGRLPTDLVRVDVQNGLPILVANADGAQIHATGTVGFPPLAWAAIVAVGSIVAYFATDKICNTITTTAEEKTAQTIAQTNADLIRAGRVTPEQAAAMTKAIYSGAKGVAQVRADAASSSAASKGMDAIGSLITGVSVIAVLGIVASVIGMLPKPKQQTA